MQAVHSDENCIGIHAVEAGLNVPVHAAVLVYILSTGMITVLVLKLSIDRMHVLVYTLSSVMINVPVYKLSTARITVPNCSQL